MKTNRQRGHILTQSEKPVGLLEGPESLPDGPEGMPEGPEGLTDGPEGLPGGSQGVEGTEGCRDGFTDGPTEYLPILQGPLPKKEKEKSDLISLG